MKRSAWTYGIGCLLTLYFGDMPAQALSGEYDLTGVPEMAAAFRFTPDGKFEFYYIYGAADRMASGTYTREGDTIRLHSDKKPGKDFHIDRQYRRGSGYTIRIKSENPVLSRNVRCIYTIGDTQHVAYADDKGSIQFDDTICDKIFVQHGIFPDVATLIKDADNRNNVFELSLDPEIQKVSFKGVDLAIHDNTLTCPPSYIMPFEDIRFVKSDGN